MSPTISTKKTKQTKRVKKSRRAMERENVIFYGVAIGVAVTIVIHLILQIISASEAGQIRAQELQAFKSERLLVLVEDEQIFTTELDIAKTARGDNLAAQRREEELDQRRAYEPDFALSNREQAMLEMLQIGGDEEMSPEDALKKIAKLASPSRSGVGVFKQKKGFKVEVAFAYEGVIKTHPEVGNYLPGIYREVRRTAAGIMRDVFAFGGPHGVTRVVVSCQNMVSIRSKGTRKKERRDLFLLTADHGKRDWTRMSRAEAESAGKKKKDLFPSMIKGAKR